MYLILADIEHEESIFLNLVLDNENGHLEIAIHEIFYHTV